MIRKINDLVFDKLTSQDIFCRTITFKGFFEIGTSASKLRENMK